MKEYIAQWSNQTGKINFVENISIGNKSIHRTIQAIGKISPYDAARQVKKQGWNSVRWNFCYAGKNDKINKRREQWLQKNPNRAQNSLLIACNNIPSHKSDQQIFIVENFPEVQIEPALVMFYFPIPFGFFISRHPGKVNL